METASLFLKPGQVILSVKGRNVPESIERVPDGSKPYEFPVAIIVNAKTASASEIVSGALQDHDRATIVGEPSFGKGLVQSVYPLSEKSGLALTTALYYIPSGRSIQKPFSAQRADGGDDFALGATATHPNERADFKTDAGRPVPGGGGIVPDIEAFPAGSVAALSRCWKPPARSRRLPPNTFAITRSPRAGKCRRRRSTSFRYGSRERQIQPSLHEWIGDRDYHQSRLKTEVYNLALGVEKGDEVAAQSDQQIQKALEAVMNPAF